MSRETVCGEDGENERMKKKTEEGETETHSDGGTPAPFNLGRTFPSRKLESHQVTRGGETSGAEGPESD